MEDSTERQKIGPELHKFDAIINQSTVIEKGTPTRYHLNVRTESHDPSEPYKKITFGQRDTNKPHKTILMVGETGIGKTTLINVMINYMLGVQREDRVWFEITDDQSDRTSAHTQTSIITVYGFYRHESPIHLTIIDTPGYGDTRGVEKDEEIARNLLSLINSAEEIDKIDAVCLVIKATQTRLSDRQIYIFDAVQSLFGKDFAENIVLLFTHSRGAIPKNVLKAVKDAKIKCAVNDENQPVYFLFDNCQSEAAAEEYQMIQEHSWNLSYTEIKGFFKFLDIKPKKLKMTKNVLQIWKQMEANISKIKSHIQEIDQQQNDLKQTQEALERHEKIVEENKNFECEVDVTYKVKVDIDPAVAKVAMCCTVCKENCHYSAWSIKDLWFSHMNDDHCTVCTNKCHKTKHLFKSAKVYVTKTKKEKRTNKDLKDIYDDNMMKVRDGESSVKKLEEELQKLKEEKMKRVMDAFHCVQTLQMIALNTDSLLTLLHIDFLIEMLKEIKESEKAETLENIKKRAGEEKQGELEYMKRCVKTEN